MNYHSTKDSGNFSNVKEAIFRGLPQDNGLYMPEDIPRLENQIIKSLSKMELPEIGFHSLRPYFSPDIPDHYLKDLTEEAFNFPVKITQIEERISSLELYHGPTLAFKDIGARFLARALQYFSLKKKTKTLVLVATSGDTGSAVANGFYGLEDVEVIILYPKGRISDLQELQMAGLGGNIKCLRIEGSFDDCQNLVKQAFLDEDLRKDLSLTSANSINIARFLPQMIYYYYGVSRLKGNKKVVSVPSGNYGNMTAGVFAQLSGLDIDNFIAASNKNDTVPRYLKNRIYSPMDSIATISNAMDVGDPSNFRRLEYLFEKYPSLINRFTGYSFTDEETLEAIKYSYQSYDYILDPHGAVGYLGLKRFLEDNREYHGLFLETAHPIKFRDHVEKVTDLTLEHPIQLMELAGKQKKYEDLNSNYSKFKNYLMSLT